MHSGPKLSEIYLNNLVCEGPEMSTLLKISSALALPLVVIKQTSANFTSYNIFQ